MPGDEVLDARLIDGLLKADERLNLVYVAADLFGHTTKLRHVGVGRVSHQLSLARGDPPQNAIEPVESGRFAMAGDGPGDVDERFRNGHGTRLARRRLVTAGEQQIVARNKRHVVRRKARVETRTGLCPPVFETLDSQRVQHGRV